MSDSSDTNKELDQYGVWVKTPPHDLTDNDTTVAEESSDPLPDFSFVDAAAQEGAAPEGIDDALSADGEISLDEFFSEGSGDEPSGDVETEDVGDGDISLDEFLDGDSAAMQESEEITDEDPLDIDLTFDDSANETAESDGDGDFSVDSLLDDVFSDDSTSSDASGERVDLSDFLSDDAPAESADSATERSAPVAAEPTESVDLSDFEGLADVVTEEASAEQPAASDVSAATTESVDLSDFEGLADIAEEAPAAQSPAPESSESSSGDAEDIDLSEFGFDDSDDGPAANTENQDGPDDLTTNFDLTVSTDDDDDGSMESSAATDATDEIVSLEMDNSDVATEEHAAEPGASAGGDDDFDIDSLLDSIEDESGESVSLDETADAATGDSPIEAIEREADFITEAADVPVAEAAPEPDVPTLSEMDIDLPEERAIPAENATERAMDVVAEESGIPATEELPPLEDVDADIPESLAIPAESASEELDDAVFDLPEAVSAEILEDIDMDDTGGEILDEEPAFSDNGDIDIPVVNDTAIIDADGEENLVEEPVLEEEHNAERVIPTVASEESNRVDEFDDVRVPEQEGDTVHADDGAVADEPTLEELELAEGQPVQTPTVIDEQNDGSESAAEDTTRTVEETAETTEQDEEDMSATNKLLEQIASELLSLKQEINGLKSEVETIKNAPVSKESTESAVPEAAADEEGFFSDEEISGDVALSGDELTNIANTTEITEAVEELPEAQEEAHEADVVVPAATEAENAGFFSEDEAEDATLSGDELTNIANTAEITEASEEATAPQETPVEEEVVPPATESAGFFSDAEMEEDASLSGDELSNILTTTEISDQPEEAAEPVLERAIPVAEEPVEDIPTISESVLEPDAEPLPPEPAQEEAVSEPVLEEVEPIAEELPVESALQETEATAEEAAPAVEEPTATESPVAETFADVAEPIDLFAEEAPQLTEDNIDYLTGDENANKEEEEGDISEEPVEQVFNDWEAAPAAVESTEATAEETAVEPPEEDILSAETTGTDESIVLDRSIAAEEPDFGEEPAAMAAVLEEEPAVEEPAAPEPEAATAVAETARPSSIPEDMKEEIKSVLSYMDQLLESLPEDKIAEFAKSEEFTTYKKLFNELGLA